MISALFFDFGGTLDGPLHWLDRFLVQYRAAGANLSREQLDRAFEHATKAGCARTSGRVSDRIEELVHIERPAVRFRRQVRTRGILQDLVQLQNICLEVRVFR